MSKLPVPLPGFLLSFLWCAAPLAAQTQFRADLNGAQEVPPVATSAAGWGEFTLSPTNTLEYEVHTYGLAANGASIHQGAAGFNGGILFTLSGGPNDWLGSTNQLSTIQLATLQAGGMYVSVHSTAHPNGEIRGQILARPVRFAARLDGTQVVPQVSTNATGNGSFVVNADRTITYELTTHNLNGAAAHLHLGAPRVSGAMQFTLSGGPTDWAGTTAPLSSPQFSEVQAGLFYVDVHTAAHPNGEIRGQLASQGVSYGYACPWSGGTVALAVNGAPYAGETIQLSLTGGIPSARGTIYVSFRDVAMDNAGCGQLVAAPFLQQIAVHFDAAGNALIPVRLPHVVQPQEPYLQFGGRDPATGMQYSSNGVCLPITVL